MKQLLMFVSLAASIAIAAVPDNGERPPDFKLSTPEGKVVQLSEGMVKGPVVLVVLRGYPGYQSPYCNRQLQDFITNAPTFADIGAHIILVYPGTPQDLRGKVDEFTTGKKLPADFDLVLDPGCDFTNAYDLRWNAPNETAYRSTFLINWEGAVFFSEMVKEHNGRTTATEVIEAMPKGRK